MGLDISPQNLGGSDSMRIGRVEHELNKIQREVDGMHRETVLAADGREWEVLARRGIKQAVDTVLNLPFRLSVRADGSNYLWRVSSIYSTITDGTNGPMIDLTGAGFDTDNSISDTKWIVLKAAIDANLLPSSWTFAAVDDPSEVIMSGTTQTEVQLLIGKIVITSTAGTASQSIFAAQRLIHDFMNRVMVRVFESAPVHKDYTPA